MNEQIQAATEVAKDPSSYPWLTYGWIVFLAMWGGTVRVLREFKLGERTWRQLALNFVTELMTSSFVGVLTFYACEAAKFSPLTTAIMTSISGYMGVRALSVLESIYQRGMNGKGD